MFLLLQTQNTPLERHNEFINLLVREFAPAVDKMNEPEANIFERAAPVFRVFAYLVSGIEVFCFFPVRIFSIAAGMLNGN